MTGDPEEGNLSGIGNDKPDQPTLDKVVSANAKIGIDAATLVSMVGKPMTDWTMAELAEVREVYAEKKAEHDNKSDL